MANASNIITFTGATLAAATLASNLLVFEGATLEATETHQPSNILVFTGTTLTDAACPVDYQCVTVGDLPWDPAHLSLLTGADPAAVEGDVIAHDPVTSPSGFAVTVLPDGTFFLSEDDDGTEQTFQYQLYRVSTSSWVGPQTVTITGAAPGLTCPAGYQCVTVGDLPWDPAHESVLEGASPAAVAGDTLAVSETTSPDAIPITIYPDGTFDLGAADNYAQQTFQYQLYRLSTASWAGPQTVTIEAAQAVGPVNGDYNGTWTPGVLRAYVAGEWKAGVVKRYVNGSWVIA